MTWIRVPCARERGRDSPHRDRRGAALSPCRNSFRVLGASGPRCV